MIVGEIASELCIPDTEELDDSEWLDENGLESMSPYYDCELELCCIGYCVEDVQMPGIDEWFTVVKEKAKEFKEFFGVDARLIGTQNIW